MNKEFKKITLENEIRYVLESATGGASSGAGGATLSLPLDKLQKRIKSLKEKISGTPKKAPPPQRNFVAKNAPKSGAGSHKPNQRQQQRDDRRLQGESENQGPDHEISMASSELQSIVTDAADLLDMIKQRSEEEGLEAWQQSEITKAADFMNSVLQSIRGDEEQSVAEGTGPQVGDEVYYGNRLVGWFKGYSKLGKIITEPNVDEMGDEYLNKDAYWDPKDITIKSKQGVAEGGILQSIKRGLQGWDKNAVGPGGEKLGDPRAIVQRAMAMDTNTARKVRAGLDAASDHSPAGLQKRVLDRKLKGVAEGDYEYNQYDELRNEIEGILIKAYDYYDTREDIINAAKPAAQKVAQQMGLAKHFNEIWSNALAGYDVDTNFGDNDPLTSPDHPTVRSMRQGEKGMEEGNDAYDPLDPRNSANTTPGMTTKDIIKRRVGQDKRGAARVRAGQPRSTHLRNIPHLPEQGMAEEGYGELDELRAEFEATINRILDREASGEKLSDTEERALELLQSLIQGENEGVVEGPEHTPRKFEIYDIRTGQQVGRPFLAPDRFQAEIIANDQLEAAGKSGRGLGVRPVKDTTQRDRNINWRNSARTAKGPWSSLDSPTRREDAYDDGYNGLSQPRKYYGPDDTKQFQAGQGDAAAAKSQHAAYTSAEEKEYLGMDVNELKQRAAEINKQILDLEPAIRAAQGDGYRPGSKLRQLSNTATELANKLAIIKRVLDKKVNQGVEEGSFWGQDKLAKQAADASGSTTTIRDRDEKGVYTATLMRKPGELKHTEVSRTYDEPQKEDQSATMSRQGVIMDLQDLFNEMDTQHLARIHKMITKQDAVRMSPKGMIAEIIDHLSDTEAFDNEALASVYKTLAKVDVTIIDGMQEGKIKGVDGKACWKGNRYAGRVKKADGTYKDRCVPVGEDAYINKLMAQLESKK